MGPTATDTTGHHRRWAKAGTVLPHGIRAESFCSLSAHTSAKLSINAGFVAQKSLEKISLVGSQQATLCTYSASHTLLLAQSRKHAPLHHQLTPLAQASAASCFLKNGAAAFLLYFLGCIAMEVMLTCGLNGVIMKNSE